MKRFLLLPPRITARLTNNRGLQLKVILMILVFITALYTKEYRGTHQLIINNNAGGIFYVLFGSLLFSVLRPKMKFFMPVIISLALTCMLEFIQYFRFPVMERLTENKAMAYLFGVSYNPVDFIWYAAGAAISVLSLFIIEFEPKAVTAQKGEEIKRDFRDNRDQRDKGKISGDRDYNRHSASVNTHPYTVSSDR